MNGISEMSKIVLAGPLSDTSLPEVLCHSLTCRLSSLVWNLDDNLVHDLVV